MGSEAPTQNLTEEQQHTASLLNRLLGNAIADRYIDFCRIAAGRANLKVPFPLAAHAVRELEGTLRNVMAAPMDARKEQPTNVKLVKVARQQLRKLGFDDAAVQRAGDSLSPQLSHKRQIRMIVERLGLDPDGDISQQWCALTDTAGKAHRRSFHQKLQIDEEFRSKLQQPFETVIRAIAVALEGRYAALMRRVEEIATMPDRAKGVEVFAKEIPGALPLQWHFFRSLKSGDWLHHLAKEGLLGEPNAAPEETSQGFRSRQWPAGDYLRRMAASPDIAIRRDVAAALREVARSSHPDIQQDGIEVLAAFPPEEAAELADLAVSWLGRDARFSFLQAAEKLLERLAVAGQQSAALAVASALLQVWSEGGQIASLYGRNMYEHYLPTAVRLLTRACGDAALNLLADLLQQAGDISGQLRSDFYSSRSIADDEMANDDVFSALISAVRTSAQMLVVDDLTQMRSVVNILVAHPAGLFTRIALHVLALKPSAAPELADAYLLDPKFIGRSWAEDEYAALALAWFQSLAPEKQRTILSIVDDMPNRYRKNFRINFERNHRTSPSEDDVRTYEALTIRDALWKWRSVLPPERLQDVERIAIEHGDPDAWRHRFFEPEQSPMDAAEFANRSVSEVVAFLKDWRPSKDELQRQTVTALGQELRAAIGNSPHLYAAHADQFIGIRPIYVRRLIEGLQNVAASLKDTEWSNTLKLIDHIAGRYDDPISPGDLADGDDKSWSWACMSAAELLAAGLRGGATGIPFASADQVQALVLKFVDITDKPTDVPDFDGDFRKGPYFAAQRTLRGSAVELCVLLVWWICREPSGHIAAAPRNALENLPAIRGAIERQLRDKTPDGWLPRAIIGRWLKTLCYFGEPWVKENALALLPTGAPVLRRAIMWGHVGNDEGPIAPLMAELHDSYAEAIDALSTEDDDRNDRNHLHERLAQYIVVLHLWGALPDHLLERFFSRASDKIRRHAMWFVGDVISQPATEERKEMNARGLKYWELRLDAATQSSRPDDYRRELAAISHWCFHGRVDETWLSDQLVQMLTAGFGPTDASDVIDWLKEISERQIDRAVEALRLLLRYPQIDRWSHMTKREVISSILKQGLERGTAETIARVHDTVGFLSTKGETSYLDLVRPPPD